jgi:hypothetical protein
VALAVMSYPPPGWLGTIIRRSSSDWFAAPEPEDAHADIGQSARTTVAATINFCWKLDPIAKLLSIVPSEFINMDMKLAKSAHAAFGCTLPSGRNVV